MTRLTTWFSNMYLLQPRLLLSASLFAAVALSLTASRLQAQSECRDGMRVVGRQSDAVLNMSWELLQDCAHPERPVRMGRAKSIAGSAQGSALPLPILARTLLIRSGDQVTLWSQDDSARIEMSASADVSGGLGDHITVCVRRESADTGVELQHLEGIVRAAGSVEMSR